ncbi:MAG TPA: DUF748 domain-containing protein [Desulfobulbaceae bacterium]|nr:DUF748 domain-containing protein [Desulfobulbaceae bacterium]
MTNRQMNKPLWKKTWFLLLCGLLLSFTAFLVLLPVATKYYLGKWLIDNGADRAVIEHVRINPFTGKAGLQGVTVRMGGATVLADADITIDIAMLRLFSKQAVIQSSVLKGISLDIELYKDGRMRFGSYTTAPSPSSATEPTEETQPSLWSFSANHIEMVDSTVRFTMPDLHLTLKIDKASLTKFTTAPGDKSGAFTLAGSVNGTPVVVDLKTLRITPDIVARGDVQVNGFALDNLSALLQPTLKPFTGSASVNGNTMFRMADNGDIFVDYDGMLSVDRGHIAGRSFSVNGAPVRWEKGKIHFSMTEKKGIKVDVDGRLTGKDIGVDIPDPVIKVRGPVVDINGKVEVTVDNAVKVDAVAGFALQNLRFSMPPLSAGVKSLVWEGKKRRIRFTSDTENTPLSVTVAGQLIADQPTFTDQDPDIRLATQGKRISWNGNISYKAGSGKQPISSVKTRGKLTGSNLAVSQGDSLHYTQKSLTNAGSINVDFGTKVPLKLQLDNAIAGKDISLNLKGAGLTIHQQSVDITDKGKLSLQKNLTVQGTGSLKANGLTIKTDNQNAPLADLKQFTIEAIQAPGGSTITIGKATADDLMVQVDGSMPLAVALPDITIHNLHSTDLKTYTIAKVTAQTPVITAKKNNAKLAGLNSLEFRHLTADTAGRVSIDRINFDDLYFLGASKKAGDNICTIGGAALSKIGWNQKTGLRGDSLSFSDLFCNLVREKDGGLVLAKRLAAMRDPTRKTTQKAAAGDRKTDATPIALAKVTLRGKNSIHFEDHTLAVPFTSNLGIKTLQIQGIDSGKPDKPASLRMDGSLEKRAPLKITGTIAPFLQELALKLHLHLKNYPLSHLSAYTVQSVGVALASGSMRLTSDIALEKRQLDMKNKVVLQQLKTSTISKELAEKLDNQLPVPLDSALAMLRDRKDTITLDVPLSGPIDKLSVGISDILITALGKAIVPAASGYLVYALGPYGALAWVGMEVGSRILEVRLPPVLFKPGDDTLPEKSEDYFKRLARILQDKPDVDFRLCPKVAAWEADADRAKEDKKKKDTPIQLSDEERNRLMELGQKRARNVKKWLVEQYGCDRDRLLICTTRIEKDTSAKPRVDIRM